MDGRVVGRGCLALMLHVVSKGRALPLAWRVRHSPTGPCPETLHIAVVELLSQMGWSSVCRTALSTTATWEGETFRLDV